MLDGIKIIEGQLTAQGLRIAIVAARFNDFIVDRLMGGAVDCLLRHGADKAALTIIRAPGAFELPLICKRLAESGQFDGIVALGAVIRGSTPHFDYVAAEVSKGLAQVSMEYGVPVAFGVLTVDSIEQAIERSGTKAGNKGAEAALSALEMVSLLAQLEAK